MNTSAKKLVYKSQRDRINNDSPVKSFIKARQTSFSHCASATAQPATAGAPPNPERFLAQSSWQQPRLTPKARKGTEPHVIYPLVNQLRSNPIKPNQA